MRRSTTPANSRVSPVNSYFLSVDIGPSRSPRYALNATSRARRTVGGSRRYLQLVVVARNNQPHGRSSAYDAVRVRHDIVLTVERDVSQRYCWRADTYPPGQVRKPADEAARSVDDALSADVRVVSHVRPTPDARTAAYSCPPVYERATGDAREVSDFSELTYTRGSVDHSIVPHDSSIRDARAGKHHRAVVDPAVAALTEIALVFDPAAEGARGRSV